MPEKKLTREIVKLPNEILRNVARELPTAEISSPKIQKLIAEMKETLAITPDGVGLAAPQVGESLRIFIVSEEAKEIAKAEKTGWERRRKDAPEIKNEKPYEKRDWKYYIFINPTIKNMAKKKLEGPEGCLSVPGKYGMVKRAEKLTVEACNELGQKFVRGCSRFFARVVQHELDHLDGTLFIDKTKKFLEVKKKK